MSLMSHDFVVTRISFGCSFSPLCFICSIAAHPVYRDTARLYVCTVFVFYLFFLIECLYLCISEPYQKLRGEVRRL